MLRYLSGLYQVVQLYTLYSCSSIDVGVKKLVFFCTPGSSEVLTWRKLPLHMSIITSSHVTKLMRHMHQFCGDETDLSLNFSCMLK